MKRLNWLLAFLTICFFVTQTYAEVDFKSWVTQQKKEYKKFLEERDKEFYSFLKGEWKNFEIEEGKIEDTKPKPKLPPIAEPDLEKISKPLKTEEIVEKKQEPVLVEEEKPVLEVKAKNLFGLEFYGEILEFPKIDDFYNLKLKNTDKDSIAEFFADFAAIDSSPIINQLKFYKSKKRLNDWGYLILAQTFSDKILDDKNSSTLFLWAILLKSGFDSRIGFYEDEVKLLFASEEDLFSMPFFTLNSKRYYLHNGNLKTLRSYDAKYEGADKKFRVALSNRPIFLTERIGFKEYGFEYKGKEYFFEGYFNPHLIEYMQSLPQLSVESYFLGEIDPLISKYLAVSIKEEIKDFSDYEKVNFILRFVQKSFPYKTDDEQFGYEKYFFPEEVIYYPYSDCEDRSALFAALVKEITGFGVLILDYPGHIATAINIPGDVKGDYISVKGKKYYVSDPTYINADVGMIMPGYENKRPSVTILN
ncbi:MAG: hypothetical protein RBR53_04985 [Desulforegulaceae bacterium]|nr:hypothetical protein [Desulforegulaceae bacterium]